MSLFDLFPGEEANQADEGLRATPKPPPGAPWYAGMIEAPLRSVALGVSKIAVPLEGDRPLPTMPPIGAPDWAYDAYARQFKPAEKLTPEQHQVRANEATAAAIKEFTPDPRVTGWVGQTLGGLADVGTRATVGSLVAGPLGAVGAVSGSSGVSTVQNLEAQGVDSATAYKAGAWDAFTSGAGMVVPFGIGAKLLTKVATGAATNVAFGMEDRYVNGQILDRAGYHEMAAQYHVLDKQAMLTDALLGSFYGGGAYLHDRLSAEGNGLPPALGDLALKSAEQLDIENAANGVPKTPQARGDHVANFDEALAAAMDDRDPVGMRDVETVPNPAQDAASATAAREVEDVAREEGAQHVDLPEPSEEDKAELLRSLQEEIRATQEENRAGSPLGRSSRLAEAAKEEGEIIGTLDPEAQEQIVAAQQHLQENPDLQITHPDSEQGETVGARDLLQSSLDDVKSAPFEGALSKIAAACSLRAD